MKITVVEKPSVVSVSYDEMKRNSGIYKHVPKIKGETAQFVISRGDNSRPLLIYNNELIEMAEHIWAEYPFVKTEAVITIGN